MRRINRILLKWACTVLLFCLGFTAFGQISEYPGKNWQLLDLKTDHLFGISMEKVYAELLKGKKADPVIVAVLDGGVDIDHEDLKASIWTNEKEIPGNGKDDDGNGFIDDVHGWNFYSSMSPGDFEFDIHELWLKLKQAKLTGQDTTRFHDALEEKLRPEQKKLQNVVSDRDALHIMLKRIGKESPLVQDFKDYIPGNERELKLQKDMVYGLKNYPGFVCYDLKLLDRMIWQYDMELAYYINQDYDMKTSGPTSYHGTHISGIIAAQRHNGIGMDGVAGLARIMPVRVIPGIDLTGNKPEAKFELVGSDDESDERMALAIRYAVDNGAKVINMSFGPIQQLLKGKRLEAINYALSKDVLMVHAAGNMGENLDNVPVHVPTNWIEVGASGPNDDASLMEAFSNYGKNTVDVFAPGVDIYSTSPRSSYQTDTGTSMAAPVVSGLAAMLRAYYPLLKATQIKDILIKTVVKREILKDKCVSGGVVNAYQAFEMIMRI